MSRSVDISKDFPADGIASVKIECSLGDLTVCKSPDDEAHVRCLNVPEGSSAELNGSALSLQVKRPGVLKTVFKSPLSNVSCTIALPDKLYDSFTAETGMGNSRIADVSCKTASVETGMGNIIIEGFKPAEDFKLEIGTGNVTADIPDCGKLEVSSGKGNTSLNCCAKELTVKGGTGNIELSGTVNGEMILKGGIGNISFEGTVNGDLTVSGGIGNISLRLREDPENPERHNVKTSHGIGKLNIEYLR